jgi:CubicO group peptidase (beta-lactamase class C family)
MISVFVVCVATSNAMANVKLNQLIKDYEATLKFSGIVYVSQDNTEIYTQATGYANQEKKIPNSLKTRFDIGSIQKDFTAVLTLQAVDKGLIKLDDTLSKFSIEFTDYQAKLITIEDLLRHRSGFADVFTAEYRANPTKFRTIAEKLELLKNRPLLFKPNSERKYSNYGYIVLGAILEEVYKTDYWTLFGQHIDKDADNSTEQKSNKYLSNNTASPYHLRYDNKTVYVPLIQREHPSPDGGGKMRVEELHSFYNALFINKKLLKPDSLNFFKSLQQSPKEWLAFGGGKGVSTAVEVDFEKNMIVIVLANVDRLQAEQLSYQIRKVLDNEQYQAPKIPPQLFAYQFFIENDEMQFQNNFKKSYSQKGYSTFIGRVITDLARELIADHKPELAFPLLKFLTIEYPDIPDVHDGLAFGYYSLGKIKEAQQAFSTARKLKTDYKSHFNPNNYER